MISDWVVVSTSVVVVYLSDCCCLLDGPDTRPTVDGPDTSTHKSIQIRSCYLHNENALRFVFCGLSCRLSSAADQPGHSISSSPHCHSSMGSTEDIAN